MPGNAPDMGVGFRSNAPCVVTPTKTYLSLKNSGGRSGFAPLSICTSAAITDAALFTLCVCDGPR